VGSQPLILLDTHALLWWVNGTPSLSARARRALRGSSLAASAISVLEIATAVRRGRLALGVPVEQWFADLALLPELTLEPVTAEIARVAGTFDDSVPGDPADRIIAATALALGARLVTADRRLRAVPRLQAVW
jgi:PIN domain nuclease of toxin-antitoxin system